MGAFIVVAVGFALVLIAMIPANLRVRTLVLGVALMAVGLAFVIAMSMGRLL